jgi:hypothetical protein
MTNTIATLGVTLRGDAKALDAALAKAERDLRAFERQMGKARGGPPIPSAVPAGEGAALARAESQTLAFARARAQLLRDSGNLAGAERLLQGALANTTRSSVATIGAQRQLLAVQKQIGRESAVAAGGVRTLSGTLGGLQSALGAIGVGVGLDVLVSQGAAAVQSANQLERTEAIMQQLAGTEARYAEITALAAQNQALFGGSLNDNLTPLNALLQLSNRTGAELQNLNTASQLLLASNPAAAFEDASFALSEFLSNSGAEAALSLADRFNLDKQALTELAAAGTTAEERLAGLSVILAEQGVTMDTLAAATSTNAATYAELGAVIDNLRTQIGGLIAEGLAPAAEGAIAAGKGISEFLTIIQGEEGILAAQHEALAQSVTSYEEYVAAAERAAQGGAAQATAIAGNIPIFGQLAVQIAGLVGQTQVLTEAEYQAAQASEENRGAKSRVAADTAGAAASMDLATLAAAGEADALRDAAAAAYEQANAGATLEAQARAAAAELLGAGSAGAAAAAQLANSSADIDVMTAAFYRLMAAKQAALGGGGALGGVGGLVKGAGAATAAMRTLNKVYNAGPLAPRPTGGGGGAGRARGGGGGGASAASKAADAEIKAAEDRAAKLADIEERAREAALSAEERYQEERLSIIEKYNEAVLDAQRDLQAESAGSRADFYDSLTQSDVPPEIAQQLSSAYEQAFAEAQRLSQAGQAALAADYLALKQDQISAEQKFQEAVQKAREDGDKGEIARLEAIKRLRDAEFSARESNLMAEGDTNVEQRDAGLADAEVKRREALTDAEIAARDAALDAEGKTREAARLTNEEYLERLRILQQLGPQGGGIPALSTPAATPAPATAPALPGAPTGGGATPVSDAGVMATLQAMQADLGGRLSAVERAVGRVAQRSTVGGLG